jgi:hypothetical protein
MLWPCRASCDRQAPDTKARTVNKGRQEVNLEHILRSFGAGNVRAMEIKGRELGPDDTVVVLDRPSLYELAKIDRNRYTIVGIDVGVDGPMTATVYAIDRWAHPIAVLGQNGGEIPVVEFSLPEAKLEDFVRLAFDQILIDQRAAPGDQVVPPAIGRQPRQDRVRPKPIGPQWARRARSLPFEGFLSRFPSINHLFKLISHVIHLA